ncbi:cAMP and cAMP-inhibited cGMP 3' [Prionailurus iriomotensis]
MSSCLPFTLRSGSKGPTLPTLRSSVDAWAQMGDDPAEGSLEPCKATG